MNLYWSQESHNICEFASESKELTGILHRAFDKVMVEMEEYQERSKGKSLLTQEEATLSNSITCQNKRSAQEQTWIKPGKKDLKCHEEKKKIAPSELNFLDSGSSIQSSSSLYNAPYMNYPREDCTKCADHIGT
ncbi:hypothetical protein Ahy_A09g045780 [Arachis hypogaea]|uniref:Uncharacterized protein n=1 Tax=Arachis hypogaea TaxID=3818 RepID=A0A445BN65_ARAHY|nr:hypothetical protein Ahy_A09g045780 [Arachis hypogaea]